MQLDLSDIERVLSLPAGAPVKVTGYSIDTRTLQPGDLFFALRGPNHDAHEHLAAAFERGAAAAVVERDVAVKGRLIRVDDTLTALQKIGAWVRERWGGEVVGITGSAGKTTSKDFIAHVLSTAFPTGKTVGNFNNHIGVPLSILRLPDDCKVAVLEMGMNHAEEIRNLARIARPEV